MQHFPVVLHANETARGTTVPHRWVQEKQEMHPRMWLWFRVTYVTLCYFSLKMARSEPKNVGET